MTDEVSQPGLIDPLTVDHKEYALSLLSKVVQEKYKEVSEAQKALSEEQLEEICTFTQMNRLLRLAFWREVDKCIANPTYKFVWRVVANGICTKEGYTAFTDTPLKIEWLLRRPPSYTDKAEEIISYGTSRLREALTAKLIYPNGYLDAKATKTILDIVNYFENRTKGRIAHSLNVNQRTESKSVNVNVNVSSSGDPKKDLVDLDQKLETLRTQIRGYEQPNPILGLPEPVSDDLMEELRKEDAGFAPEAIKEVNSRGS